MFLHTDIVEIIL